MSRVEVPPPSTRNDEFFSDDAFDLSVLETFGTDTSNMMQVSLEKSLVAGHSNYT